MSSKKKKGSSIERVLQIVEILAKSQRPMSVSDLAEVLDVPIPSMYRILEQLQNLNFVQLDSPGKVTCGKRTYKLAMDLWQNSHFKIERLSILQQLSTQIGETVGIAILQDLDVVYVDRVLSNWPLQIYLPAGSQIPAWASASGKLLLSQLPNDKCKRIIERMSIHALTTKTRTNKNHLMQAIAKSRDTKIGIDNEEFIPGMVACAVLIPNGKQQAFATLFTHGPTVRKSLEDLLSYIPVMQEAADELSLVFSQDYESLA